MGEGVQDLVHHTERDLAGNDRRSEQDVRKNVIDLQIDDAADVKVREVQIEPEIVMAPNSSLTVGGAARAGSSSPSASLLAIGCFDPLVEELDPGQPDADQIPVTRGRNADYLGTLMLPSAWRRSP
jgi:hypothetical protein